MTAAASTAATTHTPGHWAWHGYSLRAVTPNPEGSAVHTILEMECSGSGYLASDLAATTAELDADHRLIVAAPVLHAALVQARTALAQTLGTVDAALSAVAMQGGAL